MRSAHRGHGRGGAGNAETLLRKDGGKSNGVSEWD